MDRRKAARRRPMVAALAALLLVPGAARAEGERESLESLRQTTLALIEVLVANGTLTREKADELLAQAKQRAAAGLAAAAPAKPEPPVVRVPYVPQVVRDQIRNEVREEVVAQARAERWGVPNALPEWTDRIAISGDVRVRQQNDRPGSANPAPEFFLASSYTGLTRAPDFAAGTAALLPTASTQDDRNRMRVRARLEVDAKVADSVTAGVRLATGSATDRVSTNQTLGQNFNKYAFLVDRAFVRLDAAPWASVVAGRFANPWFSTDLVWDEDVNFEGAAALLRWPTAPNATVRPFATLGYFPVREAAAPRSGRSIVGAQLGLQWDWSPRTRFKVGIAQYRFRNFEGRIDPDYDSVNGPGRSYGQYEYEAGLRQRGNTLFWTNNPAQITAEGFLTPDRMKWGLASKFEPAALTFAGEWSHFAPYVVGLSAELVRNQGYHRVEVLQRTGHELYDARVFGAGVRATVGMQSLRNAGDWQASLGYRWLGGDALPDAFVDSDLGLGGTNLRGLVVGFRYGLARDTDLGLRVLSARTIESPTVQAWLKDRYSFDSVQVDLNVRF